MQPLRTMLRAACARAALRLPRAAQRPPALVLRHARWCSTQSDRLPDARAIPVDELHSTVEGGAPLVARGELGASVAQMRDFWLEAGAEEPAIESLAQRAIDDGGVWGDPETLAARMRTLGQMVPSLPRARLLKRFPNALYQHPSEIRRRIEAMSASLPGVDVLRMVARRPALLRRSAPNLQQRIGAVLSLLPRDDMGDVLGEWPNLLEISQPELEARAAAILAAYSVESISTWDARRASEMLRMSSAVLRRLQLVDELDPSLRVRHSDAHLLRLPQHVFELRFESNKSRRRPRRARPMPRDAPAAKFTRSLSAADAEPPHPAANLLAWGAQQRDAWGAARQQELEREQRDGAARKRAAREDREARGL